MTGVVLKQNPWKNPWSRQEIEDQIRQILADQMGLTAEQVTLDTTLTENLGLDSLDCVEVVMDCEDTFDISIGDADTEKIQTVRAACDYIEWRMADKYSPRGD